MTADNLKTWHVSFRVTLQGTVEVEAETADEAKRLAESWEHNDGDFYNRAEAVDWAVIGEPREVKQ